MDKQTLAANQMAQLLFATATMKMTNTTTNALVLGNFYDLLLSMGGVGYLILAKTICMQAFVSHESTIHDVAQHGGQR
ncbi:hypothetical protein ACA910_004703 [Epithemia clementina (nom. ined.)]